jgi:hypothetical protein
MNMKTIAQSEVITPLILVLMVLAAGVFITGISNWKIPLLSNVRVDIILLVVLGMAICAQGGIGRVAAAQQWLHLQSILGYLLGGLILLITLAVFVGWKLPLIQTDQQALIVIGILAGLKVINAFVHSLLA